MNKKILYIALISIGILCCEKSREWTTDSDIALKHFKTGREFHNSFNNEKALNHYQTAFKADSTFAVAAFFMADVYYDTGNMDSAKYYLKKSFQLAKNASRFEQLLINSANAEFLMNKAKAKRIRDSLITEFPSRLDVKVLKANRAFQEQHFSEAREQYFNILEEHEGYAMAYNMIGYSYALEGYFRDAVVYFRKYLDAAPNILNPYDSMAEFYIITGKYQQAQDILFDLLAHKKELLNQNKFMCAVIHLRIADTYRRLGKFEKSIEFTKKAQEIHQPIPRIHPINNFLFNLYKELEKPELMKEEYNRVKDQVSRFEANYMKILLDIVNNNFSAAEKEINNFYSKNQNRDKYYIKYLAILEGELAFAQKRFAIAADKFQTAAAIYSDVHPEKIENKYYISLGNDGQLDRAIAGLEKILNKNPNNPIALVHISQFYFENNEPQKGKSYLNYFLNLWKDADRETPLLQKALRLRNSLNPS